MEFVQLSGTGVGDFDRTKCVICQEPTQGKLISTPNGCKRIREASDIRNDSVTKRLKLMPAESDFFYYHVSNQCYKKYTKAKMRIIQEGGKSQKESGSPHGVATRAHSAARSPPNPTDAYSVNYSMNTSFVTRSHTNGTS